MKYLALFLVLVACGGIDKVDLSLNAAGNSGSNNSGGLTWNISGSHNSAGGYQFHGRINDFVSKGLWQTTGGVMNEAGSAGASSAGDNSGGTGGDDVCDMNNNNCSR